MTVHLPPADELPNLIIIGAMKCGTTSLHHYLNAHPEIAMTEAKETNFFLDEGNWHRGYGWYASLFAGGTPIRGEASPVYTALPQFAETVALRIAQSIPDAKLVYMVRDPLPRAISDYVHHRALGVERGRFVDVITDPTCPYIARSRYTTYLKIFTRHFPSEQILVETQENLLRARAMTLRRIFRYLGVDEQFHSPDFDRLWQETRGKGPLYSAAIQLLGRLPENARARIPARTRTIGKRMLALVRGGSDLPPIEPSALREVGAVLRDEVAELRELSGLPLEDWTEYDQLAGASPFPV